MTNTEYIYVTYIKTTPEKVWSAITKPEFTRQYWAKDNVSDWKKGSKWEHIDREGDGTVMITGEVLESAPPQKLTLSWVRPEDKADKSSYSRVTFLIEPVEDMVRLTVTHIDLKGEMAEKVALGWPRVLSSMKTFLETGKPLDTWAGHTQCCGKS